MACKHCGQSGHVLRGCPKKRAADKAQSRKKQYAKKKSLRAAQRLALQEKVQHQREQQASSTKAEFDRMYASYGTPCDVPASAQEEAAIQSEMMAITQREVPDVD
eukprot:TRINITY_DN13459_c0_g1_i2.p4 TRINITY_DN13459_c0_g1~~TRINITY_DN13459_c0_g1_i2.p4  ORF type:complete len:105 (-),score=46.61 TRINITY_DN13459_c0_g1_i2:137-451(-)